VHLQQPVIAIALGINQLAHPSPGYPVYSCVIVHWVQFDRFVFHVQVVGMMATSGRAQEVLQLPLLLLQPQVLFLLPITMVVTQISLYMCVAVHAIVCLCHWHLCHQHICQWHLCHQHICQWHLCHQHQHFATLLSTATQLQPLSAREAMTGTLCHIAAQQHADCCEVNMVHGMYMCCC